jgi:transcriptional regulator with XRE-family HTH domain
MEQSAMGDYNYEEQKAIGEKIKDRISALNLTRVEVAESSKVSLASIRSIIKGDKYPTGPQIKRLCATLKITPNYLLFGTENPSLLKGDSEEEIAYEILKTSYLKIKLDRDNSAIIDRLILSMLSDQYKKSEYADLIECAEYFSNTLSLYIAPTIADIAKTGVVESKAKKGKSKEIREMLSNAKEEQNKNNNV